MRVIIFNRRAGKLALCLALTARLAACGGGGGGGGVEGASSASSTSSATGSSSISGNPIAPPGASLSSALPATVSAAPAEPSVALVRVATLSDLGRQIFNDKSLSASGKMSCASCHDPAFGHASNPLSGATIAGGADSLQPGVRNVPTLGYLRFALSLGVNVAEAQAAGGFNWDGSADSFLEQARRPFLSAHEMANLTATALADKVKAALYAGDFKRLFGTTIFSDAAKTLEAAAAAVAEFQSTDPIFAPFDSKFDAVQAGRASFTLREARGLAWFVSPEKGNCASCHSPQPASIFTPALFTDFGYDNLGVPRNNDIAANRYPARFDLGLCSHVLGKVIDLTTTCGAFKAPTLRNVAKTAPYFHNGKFSNLHDVVEFYATRETDPGKWYPVVAGAVNKYDDVPAQYKKNVNVEVAPYDRKPGDAPALTEAEIRDIVVFLETLSDGWQAPKVAAPASAFSPQSATAGMR